MRRINVQALRRDLFGVALLAVMQSVSAEGPAATVTVRAMLQLESDYLKQRSESQVRKKALPKPALISIYGVMPRLWATVRLADQDIVFEQGRARPIRPATSALRLRRIKPPCVWLTQHGQRRTLCLRQAGL